MKKFVIYTYDFDMGIGGIKVMHKLCDMLNKNKFECYLMPIYLREDFYTYSEYDTPLVTQEILDNIEDCIVIYPEGTKYNPLGTKNIVRWMLGPAVPDIIETYSKSDLIYWYMDYYYAEKLGQRENQLMIAEYHRNIFRDLGYERKGSCYCFRKNPNPPKLIHPEDSIFIPYDGARDMVGLSELFNKTEKFYCYDHYSFLYTQAAMCGCIAIVPPVPGVSKEKWLSGSRFQQYGIAYGEEDIPRALETLPLMFKELENIELEMNEKVIIFAEHCQKYFNK